jgi:broad specificity phosphatase PhoE
MTYIYLVRHGETFAKTVENELGAPFVCGSGSEISRSTHLTENGKQQMFQVGQNYKDVSFDIAIVSDLVRSRESAEEFLKGAGQLSLVDKIIVYEGVTEIDYGTDDGMLEATVKEKKKLFFSDSTKTAEDYDNFRGGETYSAASARMKQTLFNLAKNNLDKNILVLSHSGSMRAFLGNVVPGQDLDFGQVVKLAFDGEVLHLV